MHAITLILMILSFCFFIVSAVIAKRNGWSGYFTAIGLALWALSTILRNLVH